MKKIITLPNFLSLLRLFMIPVLVYFILNISDSSFLLLIFLYLITVFLDFLDGFFARRLGQESDMGKILDPLADKALVLAVLITLTIRADFPKLLAILIVLRDFLILVAAFLIYRVRRVIKPSLFIGKVTFGIISTLIFIYIVDLHSSMELQTLKHFLTALSYMFLLWSWVEYFKVYQREKASEAKAGLGR
jgi:cardiolipin synthase (CMP-forming)